MRISIECRVTVLIDRDLTHQQVTDLMGGKLTLDEIVDGYDAMRAVTAEDANLDIDFVDWEFAGQ